MKGKERQQEWNMCKSTGNPLQFLFDLYSVEYMSNISCLIFNLIKIIVLLEIHILNLKPTLQHITKQLGREKEKTEKVVKC